MHVSSTVASAYRAPSNTLPLCGGVNFLIWSMVGAALCISVDTLSNSVWRQLPPAAGSGAFASLAGPDVSFGLRLRLPRAGIDAAQNGAMSPRERSTTPGTRGGGRASTCRTIVQMGVPLAGFVSALRQRLLPTDGAAKDTGDYGNDEVGALDVFDVRLDGSKQRRVLWDGTRGRLFTVAVRKSKAGAHSGLTENEFTSLSTISGGYGFIRSPAQAWSIVSSQVSQAFLPRGVTADYYAFTLWRMAQRIVSSSVSVFGTQVYLCGRVWVRGCGVCLLCSCVIVCVRKREMEKERQKERDRRKKRKSKRERVLMQVFSSFFFLERD